MLLRRVATPDLPLLVALYNATDGPHEEGEAVDLHAFRDAYFRPPRERVAHAFGAFEPDGRARGFVVLTVPAGPTAVRVARVRRLTADANDVADALLAAATSFAREERAAVLRGVAITPTERGALPRAGWPEADSFLEMRRDGGAPEVSVKALRVTEAGPADDVDAARVVTAAFTGATYRGPWTWEDAAKARGRGPCIVARNAAGRVVGFTAVRPRQGEPDAAELEHVAVSPDARGQGAGRALVAAALATAVDHGWRTQHLYVHPSNAAALRIYRDLGFAQSDRFVIHETAL